MNDNEKYIEEFVKDIPFEAPDEKHRDSLSKQLLNAFPRHRLQPTVPTVRLWRIIMKSRMAKCSTAAVVILARIILLWHEKSVTSRAYGLTEALEHCKQAKIVHIKGWTFFPKDTADDQELRGLPYEKWIDREKGYFRELRPAGRFEASEDRTPNHYLRVSDGQYVMKTFYTTHKRLLRKYTEKMAKYIKLSPFQQRLQMRTMQNILDYYSVCDVDGFTKIGAEMIDGEELNIWQGEVTIPGYSVPYEKRMVWLSPKSGEIKQIFRWTNTQRDNNAVSWRLAGISNFEYEVTPPEGCFDTAPPPGSELENTKKTAVQLDLGMWDGRETFYICVGFNLNDGSIILGWHAHVEGQGSQEHLFKGLEPGGPLPKLPGQIAELVLWPANENVVYVGRHLAHTQRAGKFYEWGIYVPNRDVPKRSLFTNLKVRKEYHNCSERDFPGWPNLVTNEVNVYSEEEFDSWVLGAMAEQSDDGKAPEHISYKNVLQLAAKIRSSLTK